eukprot:EG_transcript_4452
MPWGCFGGLWRRRRPSPRPSGHPWALPAEDLVVPASPHTLGMGSHGPVVQGTFRGAPVAVKPLLAGAAPLPRGAYCPRGPADPAGGPGGAAPDSFSSSSPSHRWSSDGSSVPPLRPAQGWTVGSVLTRSVPQPTFFKRKRLSVSQFLTVLPEGDAGPVKASPAAGGGLAPAPKGNTPSPRCKDVMAALRKEVEILFGLRHQNLLPVLGVVLSPVGCPLLVTELMENGTLHDVLHRPSAPLDGPPRLVILQEVLDGLAFLHESGILHTNLHSRKVLLDRKLTPKITGFGLVTPGDRRPCTAPRLSPWLAPELLRREPPSPAADVYAFALLAFETLTGQAPFAEWDAADVVQRLVTEDPAVPQCWLRPVLSVPHRMALGPELVALLEAAWHACPAVRPALGEVRTALRQPRGFDATGPWWGGPAHDDLTPTSPEADDTDGPLFLTPRSGRSLAPSLPITPRHRQPSDTETFPCVTCVFADIVGFSAIASTLTSGQTVDLLAALFVRLDGLAARHGLHCVDVIGDAYMAVCGLHGESEAQQVAAVCRWCDEAIEAAHNTPVLAGEPGRGTLRLRCGVHCGPCTAAVVSGATGRPSFFGDTINVASRMESLSAPDCVQLSERAAAALEGSAGWPWAGRALQCRGAIPVKGKGPLVTYWLC